MAVIWPAHCQRGRQQLKSQGIFPESVLNLGQGIKSVKLIDHTATVNNDSGIQLDELMI